MRNQLIALKLLESLGLLIATIKDKITLREIKDIKSVTEATFSLVSLTNLNVS